MGMFSPLMRQGKPRWAVNMLRAVLAKVLASSWAVLLLPNEMRQMCLALCSRHLHILERRALAPTSDAGLGAPPPSLADFQAKWAGVKASLVPVRLENSILTLVNHSIMAALVSVLQRS